MKLVYWKVFMMALIAVAVIAVNSSLIHFITNSCILFLCLCFYIQDVGPLRTYTGGDTRTATIQPPRDTGSKQQEDY